MLAPKLLKGTHKFNKYNIKWFLINPFSKKKQAWDNLMIFLVLVTTIYAPYVASFLEPSKSPILFLFETVFDLGLIFDIFLSFLTSFERNDGSFETQPKKIAVTYFFMGGFWLDLIAISPVQFFEQSVSMLSVKKQQEYLKFFSMMRIIRVIKVLKLKKYYNHIFKLIDTFKLKPTHSRIILILIGAMLLVHIFSCFFYLSARLYNFSRHTWVYNTNNLNTSPVKCYMLCVYWAFQTLTTVGYGDFGCYNSNEILITNIWMFIGVAFYSFVVGSLTSTISELNSQSELLANKIKALEDFSKEAGLDP